MTFKNVRVFFGVSSVHTLKKKCESVVICAQSRLETVIWMRMKKGEYIEGRQRGYWCVCVYVRGGRWGDNDKHHLGSLITKVHQSTV